MFDRFFRNPSPERPYIQWTDFLEGNAMRNGFGFFVLIVLAAFLGMHVLQGVFGVIGGLILAPLVSIGALVFVGLILVLVLSGVGIIGVGAMALAGLVVFAVLIPVMLPLLIIALPVILLLKLCRVF
jgi:hypothetical protein